MDSPHFLQRRFDVFMVGKPDARQPHDARTGGPDDRAGKPDSIAASWKANQAFTVKWSPADPIPVKPSGFGDRF
jgi:hypothetical protein